MDNIVLTSFGGHAKSVADAIEQAGIFNIVGYTDTKQSDDSRYQWLGTDDMLKECFDSGILYATVSIGYMGCSYVRDDLYAMLKKIGYQLPFIIDPSAVIAKDVQIGEGTFVGKGAIINSGAKIGKMCIINSGALIEHESIVDDYTHIAVRAVLCGNVKVGNHSFIGANATIVQGIQIADRSFVKAGRVITKNITNI